MFGSFQGRENLLPLSHLTNLTNLTDAVSRNLFFLKFVAGFVFLQKNSSVPLGRPYIGDTLIPPVKAGNPYFNGTYKPLRIIALMSRPPLLPSLKQT